MEQRPWEAASSQLYKKYPACCGTGSYMPSNPVSLRSILILFFHLCLGLQHYLYPSGFPSETLCVFLFSLLVMQFFTSPTTISLFGLCISLNIIILKAPSLCSSFNVRVLCILIYIFIGSKQAGRNFGTKW